MPSAAATGSALRTCTSCRREIDHRRPAGLGARACAGWPRLCERDAVQSGHRSVCPQSGHHRCQHLRSAKPAMVPTSAQATATASAEVSDMATPSSERP